MNACHFAACQLPKLKVVDVASVSYASCI
jgi:hypothetical protein